MTRTTKLELAQLLAERNQQLEAARARISLLEHQVAMLHRAAAVATNVAVLADAKAACVSAPTSAYRQALTKAREHAMRTGTVVCVGGMQ